MGLLAALAVIVTSATVVLYGKAIWDPVDLASRMQGMTVLVALIILLIDTVSVNLAANLVGPAYDFSALAPRRISYRAGGYITAGIALVMMPWKVLETTQGYIFTWLTGYSALLGPIAGILIIDYYFIRKTERCRSTSCTSTTAPIRTPTAGIWRPLSPLSSASRRTFRASLNAAFPASFGGIGDTFKLIYTYAWFVGVLISGLVYGALMKAPGPVILKENQA